MSFLNQLTALASKTPHPHQHAEFLAKRDSDLANAEGALLSLYQELEEHRAALFHEQSIREQMETELCRRDSEISNLVQTIREMQVKEGKEERGKTTIEALRRERILEEKVKDLESKLWNSKNPYPEGNKFGMELEQHVVTSSDDPEASPAFETNAEMMELDDFRQRYSALAMQVKIAKDEILQRDSTIQSLERKCKRLEEKEMKAQAELMSLSSSVNDDMDVAMRALTQENTELKDRAGHINRLLDLRQLELQTLRDELAKSKHCYMELQREFNTVKDQRQCFDKDKETCDLENKLSQVELLAEKRRLEVEGLQVELDTSMKRYLLLQRECSEMKDQHSNDIEKARLEFQEETNKFNILSESSRKEILYLQENLAEEKKRCKKLHDELEEMRQEKESLQNGHQQEKLKEIQTSKQKLETLLSQLQSEVSLWKNQVDILKQTCRSLEDEMSDIITERDSLRKSGEILQNEIQHLTQELNNARNCTDSREGEATAIDFIIQENKKMAEEIGRLKSSRECSQQEALAQLRASLMSELASNNALKDEIFLNRTIECFSKRAEEEQKMFVDSLRGKEVSKIKIQNEELQRELDETQEKLRRCQRELTDVNVKVEEYTIKMNAKERSIEHANSELQYYQTQVSDLRKELVEQKYRYEDLSKEFNLLKAESGRLHFLHEVNEQLEQDLENAEEQLDLLQQQLDEANSKASLQIGEQATSVDELAKQNNILAIELDAAYQKISSIESGLAAQNRKFKTAEMIRDENLVYIGRASFKSDVESIQDENSLGRQSGKFVSIEERWTLMEPMLLEEKLNKNSSRPWHQLSSFTSADSFNASEKNPWQSRLADGKEHAPSIESRSRSKKRDFIVF
jgi:chromosome segregation ATPase